MNAVTIKFILGTGLKRNSINAQTGCGLHTKIKSYSHIVLVWIIKTPFLLRFQKFGSADFIHYSTERLWLQHTRKIKGKQKTLTGK